MSEMQENEKLRKARVSDLLNEINGKRRGGICVITHIRLDLFLTHAHITPLREGLSYTKSPDTK